MQRGPAARGGRCALPRVPWRRWRGLGPCGWHDSTLGCEDREGARQTAERHTSAEFVGFLEQVVSGCKPHQEIHIILDNLSAHKTSQVEEFLKRNPNAKLHFTPTYSSWLNQVEIWFARLEREVIARGIFTSVQDLSRKLMRYIRAYSKTARPFKWKYSDVRKRILPC